MTNQQSQTTENQIKPYQTILESASGVLQHRKFLTIKLTVTSGHTRKTYKECIADIDAALQMVFDAKYSQTPEDERIDDLLSFYDAIDRAML